MRTFLIVSGVTLGLIGGSVAWLPNDVIAPMLRTMEIHNGLTMADADKQAAVAHDKAVEAGKEAVESGKNVVDAAKEVAQDLQAGDATRGLEKLEQVWSIHLDKLAKVQEACDAYSPRLDTLKEEAQAGEEHWNEIIGGIADPQIKASQQKRKDRRMRDVSRKLQVGGKTLQVLRAGVSRGGDTKLAIQSLREDALMGAIGGRLDAVITEMKDANSGLERALAALSSSIETDLVEARSL